MDPAVKRLNNTVSSMIGMTRRDAIKLDTVLKKRYYPKMDYIDTFINLTNNMETKKDGQQTLFGIKIRIDYIELYKNQVIVSYIICRTDPIQLLCVKN